MASIFRARELGCVAARVAGGDSRAQAINRKGVKTPSRHLTQLSGAMAEGGETNRERLRAISGNTCRLE